METEIIFKNAGRKWTYQEDTQLRKLYIDDKLKLLEICEKHNRGPGGIISRLNYHNLIEENTDIRGYNEYILWKKRMNNKDKLNKSWSQEEDGQLNKLYNEDMLSIIPISKVHNRGVDEILDRLCKNNYIVYRESARGYNEYLNSDLYIENVINNKNNNKQSTNFGQIELQNDVKEMKSEITYLKSSIKELIDMMKALYEFEDT